MKTQAQYPAEDLGPVDTSNLGNHRSFKAADRRAYKAVPAKVGEFPSKVDTCHAKKAGQLPELMSALTTREVEKGYEGTLPAGFSLELCAAGGPHFAKVIDENGKHRRFIPRPPSDLRDFLRTAKKCVFLGCKIGLVDPISARAVEDAGQSPDVRVLGAALRQAAANLESGVQIRSE